MKVFRKRSFVPSNSLDPINAMHRCLNVGGLCKFRNGKKDCARIQRSQSHHACPLSPSLPPLPLLAVNRPNCATLPTTTRPHFRKKNFCPTTLPPTLAVWQLSVCWAPKHCHDTCWYCDPVSWRIWIVWLQVRLTNADIILLIHQRKLLPFQLMIKLIFRAQTLLRDSIPPWQ